MEKNLNSNKKFKALIISGYVPPATNGSGLMMYNLLKYFPENSFAFLTETIDTNPKLAHYRPTVPYYCYGDNFTSLTFNPKQHGVISHIKNIIKSNVVIKFFGQLFYLPYVINKIIKVGKIAIEKEKPTILIGYSDYGPNLCATYILHKITGIPFVIYMYDAYADNRLPFVFKLFSKVLEPKLFRNAKHIFVMCDALQEHYATKYNIKNITIIYNSLIDMNLRIPKIDRGDTTFKIIYIGNIYWAQIGALRTLISSLEAIPDTPTHLELYTSHTKKYLHELGIYENKKISFNTCLPEEVPTVLSNSDLAFVGLSFDTKYPLLINTSSPGRLYDFIRSNTPILIHAPKDSFIVNYARENDFAFIVDTNDKDSLIQEIKFIQNNKDVCATKIKNAQNIGLKNHTAEKEAEKYLKVLMNI